MNTPNEVTKRCFDTLLAAAAADNFSNLFQLATRISAVLTRRLFIVSAESGTTHAEGSHSDISRRVAPEWLHGFIVAASL